MPRFTFFAALGAVIQSGRHHREVFKMFDPSFDYRAAWQARLAKGEAYEFLASDSYADAMACLRTRRQLGYVVGVAGNQPEGCEAALREAGVEVDILATSATWGVEKPSLQFFERIVQAASFPAGAIAYVGDHFDNDIEPAHGAGLVPIFIKRGPWALLRNAAGLATAARASVSIWQCFRKLFIDTGLWRGRRSSTSSLRSLAGRCWRAVS